MSATGEVETSESGETHILEGGEDGGANERRERALRTVNAIINHNMDHHLTPLSSMMKFYCWIGHD